MDKATVNITRFYITIKPDNQTINEDLLNSLLPSIQICCNELIGSITDTTVYFSIIYSADTIYVLGEFVFSPETNKKSQTIRVKRIESVLEDNITKKHNVKATLTNSNMKDVNILLLNALCNNFKYYKGPKLLNTEIPKGI